MSSFQWSVVSNQWTVVSDRWSANGLSDQIKRCAVSIPSNIAEGQSRQHTAEFRQFLYISLGSLAELDTQLIIAYRLGYIDSNVSGLYTAKIIELRKMISTLATKLKR